MLVESIAILMILAVMLFLFLRAHRRDYAVATIPLMIVPFVHALVYLAGDVLRISISSDVRAAGDVLGLAISVALIGMICVRLKTRRSKYAYLLLCGGFSTALTMIYVFGIYVPA